MRGQAKNLRESEIVARVIREWESMTMAQKNRYMDPNYGMVTLSLAPLATPSKGSHAKANLQTTKEAKELADDNSDMLLEDIEIKGFELSESSKGRKSKKITKKNQQMEYINFFKVHMAKLRREHPRWSVKQCSSIVALLWRKTKSNKTVSSRKLKPMKPVSGRKFFLNLRRSSRVALKEMMQRWKRLPRESRQMWSEKGNPSLKSLAPRMMTRTMKFSGENVSSPMGFLNSMMM